MAAKAFREYFPGEPSFTEKDVADQHGRVFLVTGGYAGIGYELTKMLYHLNGKVWIAGRSKAKAEAAIEQIKSSSAIAEQTVTSGKGELRYLELDLSDLSTIKNSAEEFLGQEERLDVVWHNAGVMLPAEGSKTAQDLDLQFGTNVVGPHLLQHFLTPLCLRTLQRDDVSKGATRVIFVSSNASGRAPEPDGVDWDDINLIKRGTGLKSNLMKYGQSKAMNIMQAYETARRYGDHGLVSLSLHPGALKTNLQANMPMLLNAIFQPLRSQPRFGALTELYAGFTKDVDAQFYKEGGGKNGAYISPWGKFDPEDPFVFDGLKQKNTGEKLWDTLEKIVKPYI